jgi:hypothetical protein
VVDEALLGLHASGVSSAQKHEARLRRMKRRLRAMKRSLTASFTIFAFFRKRQKWWSSRHLNITLIVALAVNKYYRKKSRGTENPSPPPLM